MATIQYARLYPDVTQLQAKDGHNLTAGWVEVYLAGTDDLAITYADFNGTVNAEDHCRRQRSFLRNRGQVQGLPCGGL